MGMKEISKYSSILRKSLMVTLFSSHLTVFAQAPDTQWTKTYGGLGGHVGRSVQQTNDGGYIVAGYSHTPDDIYVVKTDSLGNMIWARSYGSNDIDEAYAIQQTQDEGYIITGLTHLPGLFRVYLLKTDSNGDTIWSKIYGEFEDGGYFVRQTSDNGYAVVG
ncbi:MAG: hypothetical protein N3A65_01600, partial [candidate division WOR-3 bacterium]|nr:hypothetical protein [candidate division WOR-3 bacterium]